MWQDWLNFILGLWLIVSGFIPSLLTGSGNLWNHLIVGILILIFSIWVVKSRWPEWINFILSIWLIIAAFIPSIADVTAKWNNIIVGILIVIFAIWAASMKPKTTEVG